MLHTTCPRTAAAISAAVYRARRDAATRCGLPGRATGRRLLRLAALITSRPTAPVIVCATCGQEPDHFRLCGCCYTLVAA